jgi:NAD+ synthetase
MIDYKKFYDNAVEFLVSYAHENHLQSYVLGISGGIDSTVVAAIANEACKRASIELIGRSLPTMTNANDEREAALLVGKAFCTDFKEINIGNPSVSLLSFLTSTEGEMSSLQKGNIKARLRMIYLYHLASMHRGCVLDTDNKTEHELGFFTIHGDVGDLNCGLIHLWKTDVYNVAKWIHDFAPNCTTQTALQAMEKSIELIPTDGNGVKEGGDCAQFGLENYSQVDDVLKTMYFGTPKITKDKDAYIRLVDKYNEQGVDKVMTLHQNSKFKRKHLPIYPDKYTVV